MFKVVLYSVTVGSAIAFAAWEISLKQHLTDEGEQSEIGAFSRGMTNSLSESLKRERLLQSLPSQELSTYKTVVFMKFVCVAALLVEVILLQRP